MSNLLKYLGFRYELDFDPFGLRQPSDFLRVRVQDILFRIEGKTPVTFESLSDTVHENFVYGCRQISRIEISLDRDLNVNRNFVNHCVGWLFNFSSFRKGLIRGLNDNPKLAQITREL